MHPYSKNDAVLYKKNAVLYKTKCIDIIYGASSGIRILNTYIFEENWFCILREIRKLTVMAQIVCKKLTSWKYSRTEIIRKISGYWQASCWAIFGFLGHILHYLQGFLFWESVLLWSSNQVSQKWSNFKISSFWLTLFGLHKRNAFSK